MESSIAVVELSPEEIAFDTASSSLAQAKGELAKAEETWLIIEMRREELESN